MYDLSRLNPTPDAIAVYASQPLSPVATQHSLPSGRYSLLGPDFHRLDRTSLRLAHLLDHLVRNGEHPRRDSEAECLGGVEVDHELEFGGPGDRQVARLLALENPPSVDADLAIGIGKAGSVAHQAAGCGTLAQCIDCM